MSQPYERGAEIPAPGKLDATLGEFWVENPWDIVQKGHNLSAYERNRVFLNLQGRDFIDISSLTSADNDGDSRCVVAGDFRNNGQLDLLVRQVTGGPIILYENNFPRRHYLEVSLRGRKSNRQGIGARITATVNGQQIVREMYPLNSYRSQMPNRIHFGLGDAERVQRLTIRWPSGTVQEFTGVAGDRHIVVDESSEGGSIFETAVPGQAIRP